MSENVKILKDAIELIDKYLDGRFDVYYQKHDMEIRINCLGIFKINDIMYIYNKPNQDNLHHVDDLSMEVLQYFYNQVSYAVEVY